MSSLPEQPDIPKSSSRISLEAKRRSVEEKLNLVLEKRIMSIEGKNKNQEPNYPDKNAKSSSVENIKTQIPLKTEVTKSLSVGSSRRDSLNTLAHDFSPSKPSSNSTINVSVITSTPLRSRSACSQEPKDVVVITKKSPEPSSSTTVRITSDSPDPSNSLASNISQVTVVTTHPPILIDATSTPPPRRSSPSSEVVIVANDTNKTQVNESSTDDDGFTSLDSLEYTPQEQPIVIADLTKRIGKKLDESEVIIVSPIVEQDLQDTSHVSVVTVGDEKEHVKDSSVTKKKLISSNDKLCGKDDSDDEGIIKSGLIVAGMTLESTDVDEVEASIKKTINGGVKEADLRIKERHNDVKQTKRVSPDSYEGSRSQSDASSTRSHTPNKIIDRSDAESISTTISQDSRGSNKENHVSRQSEEEDRVVLRRKSDYTRETPKTRTKEVS